jgi:hypothetical protein
MRRKKPGIRERARNLETPRISERAIPNKKPTEDERYFYKTKEQI